MSQTKTGGSIWYDDWVKNIPMLEDKVILITGTTSGTGYFTALAAIRKHAKAIFLLNRNSQRSIESHEKLLAEVEKENAGTVLHKIPCDLMDFASVKQAATEVNDICNEYEQGLNIIINNAGIMAFPDNRTKDGFDVQIQTNHLSHFLLTKLLMPSITKNAENKEVRIVQHSSAARNIPGGNLEHRFFQQCKEHSLGGNGLLNCFRRYHQTKLSNAVLTLKLTKELAAKGLNIKSVGAEPGIAATELSDNLLSSHKNPSLFSKIQGGIYSFAVKFLVPTQAAADGALPLIQASFGDDVASGDFYVPKHGTKGEPLRLIHAGEETSKTKSSEKLMFSQTNQDNLWKWSEEALGITFFE